MTPEVQGHRGAGLLAPENTEESFSHAVAHKYDAVEMDLWVTKDNKVRRYYLFFFDLIFLQVLSRLLSFTGEMRGSKNQIPSHLKKYINKRAKFLYYMMS